MNANLCLIWWVFVIVYEMHSTHGLVYIISFYWRVKWCHFLYLKSKVLFVIWLVRCNYQINIQSVLIHSNRKSYPSWSDCSKMKYYCYGLRVGSQHSFYTLDKFLHFWYTQVCFWCIFYVFWMIFSPLSTFIPGQDMCVLVCFWCFFHAFCQVTEKLQHILLLLTALELTALVWTFWCRLKMH